MAQNSATANTSNERRSCTTAARRSSTDAERLLVALRQVFELGGMSAQERIVAFRGLPILFFFDRFFGTKESSRFSSSTLSRYEG